MKKSIIAGILALAFLASPLAASAATVAELQAQLEALLRQVSEIQSQIRAQEGNSVSFCHTWNTNLRIGDQGSDVSALVTALNLEKILNGKTDTFDEEVASAVTEFQEKYASEILKPHNLRRGNGFVGKSTRAKLNALYGCASIKPIPSPTAAFKIKVVPQPQRGSNAYDYIATSNSVLFDKVVFRADCSDSEVTIAAKGGMLCNENNSVGFETPRDSYTYPVDWISNDGKDHTVGMTVTAYKNGSAIGTERDALTVYALTPSGKPSVTVLSPDGGENYSTGGSLPIVWVQRNAVGPITVSLFNNVTGTTYYSGKSSGGTIKTGVTLSSADLKDVPTGQYRVTVCDEGSTNPEATGKPLCDSSNSAFTITANNIAVTATITSPSVFHYTTPTITGTATGVTQVGVVLFDNGGKAYGSGLIPVTNGKWSVTVSPALAQGNYSVAIYDANNVKLTSGTLTVTSATKPQPSITVLSPNGGETFVQGKTHTIRWSSSNITSAYVLIGLVGPAGTNISQVEPHATNSGSFNWTVFTGLKPGQYKIIVTDPNNVSVSDQSDSYFTIKPAPVKPVITSFSAVPGTTGYDYDINWTSSIPALAYVTVDCTGTNIPETLTYHFKNANTGTTITCPLESWGGLRGTTIVQGYPGKEGTLLTKKFVGSPTTARFTLTLFSPEDESLYDQKEIYVRYTPPTPIPTP